MRAAWSMECGLVGIGNVWGREEGGGHHLGPGQTPCVEASTWVWHAHERPGHPLSPHKPHCLRHAPTPVGTSTCTSAHLPRCPSKPHIQRSNFNWFCQALGPPEKQIAPQLQAIYGDQARPMGSGAIHVHLPLPADCPISLYAEEEGPHECQLEFMWVGCLLMGVRM